MTRAVAPIVGLAASLLVALAAAGASGQPLFGVRQDPLAGARVFGAKGCARCHAIGGRGGTIGPDLARVARPRSFYDLGAAMWNHLPRMADEMRRTRIARPELSPPEAADLIGFLYTVNYFDRPGNRDRGRGLFTEKRCIVCHQYGGSGGVIGPPLDFLERFGSPIYVASALWNHGPSMGDTMRRGQIERPTFNGAELRDLAAYLAPASAGPPDGPVYVLPGRAAEGRRLFSEKRCIDCHRAAGAGGRGGPDLAGRALSGSLTEFAAAMWNKAPAMTAEMKTRRVPVPTLRPEEMADIVAYLYAVQYFAARGNVERGRRVAAEKGCLGCHGDAGRVATGGRTVGRTTRLESPAAVIAALWNHTLLVDRAGGRGAWPQISEKELADLAALLRSGWKTP